jgi:hypothetical protein
MTRGLFFLALVASVAAVAAPAQAAKPATTPLERVSALVQPSIVYLETTFTARVYDNFNHGFVRDAAFEVGYRCSGFFVNPGLHRNGGPLRRD